MFFQLSDEGPSCSISSTLKGSIRSRRQKKLRRKNKLKAIKNLQISNKQKAHTPVPSVPTFPPVPITMSAYAENFTRAATWQLKHELAYWKSKAMALEHENLILHRTVRQIIGHNDKKNISFAATSPAESYENLPEDQYSDDASDVQDEASEKDFEVSEEFIQFLRENQEYRESARKERERIKNQNDDEQKQIKEMEAGPSENTEDNQETLKKLYGDNSERIAALEMSLKAKFISIMDRDEPTYWPNIPFNFNFG